MNILVINRWVGYNEGGNETLIKDLISQFIKKGHHVTVITTQGKALETFGDNINVIYINSPQKYFAYGLGGFYFAFLFILKSFIAFIKLYFSGQRFDILSIHFSLEAFLARIIRLFFGIPYTMYLAGDTPLELIEAKRADGKIQISEFMNKQCQKFGYNAEIIPKGFDLNLYNPNNDASKFKESLGLDSKKVILTMCRLDPRKNLVTLIDAAHILKEQNKLNNTVFIIAGEGVESDMLKQKTQEYGLGDSIIFVGSVPNKSPEHPLYYAMADLFVLPTLYEGFGWVFLEAMASGVPIITTDAGSNPEVVGSVGILVTPKNPQLLAENIFKVLTDRQMAENMIQKGLNKAQLFSWNKVADKIEEHYLRISKKKSDSIAKKLKEIGNIFEDIIAIGSSLIRDKVLFNNEVQSFSVSGQKGGLDGSIQRK